MLKRLKLSSFLSWASKPMKKPLVVLGARQVGKTFLLKQLARESFPQYHYFNFEEQTDLGAIFERDLTPSRIITELEFKSARSIAAGSDLIIFDEIQACPRALTSLKYFNEKMPEQSVCAAGSLLGLELSNASFPVGNVEILDLYPLSFEEFLIAVGDEKLAKAYSLQTHEATFSDAAHSRLWSLLALYFAVGGLPANVNIVAGGGEVTLERLLQIREQQQQLVRNYLADMSKHCGEVNAMHLDRLFRAVPSQLSQWVDGSTQRFKMSGVVPGISQYSRLVNGFDWLTKSGLILKVPIIEQPEPPLVARAKESRMKVYLLDVGLLGAMANIDPAQIAHYDLGSYKGFMAENFVAQLLRGEYF